MTDVPVTTFFKVIALALIVGAAAMLGGLGVALYSSNQIDQAKTTAEDNARVLELLAAMTGCQPTDTVDQCTVRVRTTSTAEGARRIGEVDCVTRRALAGLPSPNPPDTCISQTPPDVYPGTNQRSTQ